MNKQTSLDTLDKHSLRCYKQVIKDFTCEITGSKDTQYIYCEGALINYAGKADLICESCKQKYDIHTKSETIKTMSKEEIQQTNTEENIEWISADANNWIPTKEGETLQGGITQIRKHEFENYLIATIEDAQGQLNSVILGSVLATKFERLAIAEGDTVRIVYAGTKTAEKTKREYKDFDVYMKKQR